MIYKNGHVHMFEATKFKFNGRAYEWVAANPTTNGAIDMGASEVAAVWQVGVRWRLRLGKKPSG